MKISKKATAVLVAGVLSGALAGCGTGGGGDDGTGEDDGRATGTSLQSKINAPAAFDRGHGWEIGAGWMPEGQAFPYAVSAKSGKIAYLAKAKQGYVLNVREASTGKLLSAGKPWKAPELTASQTQRGQGLTVPRVVLVSQGEREYFAIWAYGQKRKDQLHGYKEVFSVAFYPADASGKDVAPSGSADVEYENDNTGVFPGPGGLVFASAYADEVSVSPAGKVTKIAEVKIGGQPVEPDDMMSVPGPQGLVTNADAEGSSGEGGGFGADGGWRSADVTPPGVAKILKPDPGMAGPEGPNGHIVGVADSHLIVGWAGKDGMSSSLHDVATGKVEATAPCDTAATSYEAQVPVRASREDTPPALSHNGTYLAKGGNIFNLRTGKGFCADADEDAKKISLTAVGDDGTAYGTAKEGTGNDEPWIPVSVSARTGAKPLPAKTEIPYALTKDAGVFFTYAGGKGLRMVVLHLKG